MSVLVSQGVLQNFCPQSITAHIVFAAAAATKVSKKHFLGSERFFVQVPHHRPRRALESQRTPTAPGEGLSQKIG